MARSNGAMCVSMIILMMIMGAAAQAPAPSVDCQTVVLTLADCLSYVMGTEKTPPAACCTELSSVISTTPQCLCLLFNTTFTEPLGVNVTIAQQLPPACKLQTPPTSLCSLFGVPVPAPMSAAAPSPAASASSPTAAPASAPMAASPMSSPSSAPAGSAMAPSGSMVPAATPPANDSSTTPPNSAPSITSQNVAVAGSLLFLASIFLS